MIQLLSETFKDTRITIFIFYLLHHRLCEQQRCHRARQHHCCVISHFHILPTFTNKNTTRSRVHHFPHSNGQIQASSIRREAQNLQRQSQPYRQRQNEGNLPNSNAGIKDGRRSNVGNIRGAQLGNESEDIAYLPVFSQTHLSLKGRGESLDAAGGNSPPIPYASESHTYQQSLNPPERYPVPEAGLHALALDDSEAFFTDHQPVSVEEKKEHLVVARNSLEVLSSILNSEAEPKPLKEELTLSLLDKCKQSLYVIKEIVQSTTNDEETLFEALYLNDELQQLVSKYEELEASQSLGEQQSQNADAAKNDAEAVQNLNERREGDKSEESEAAQNLDRKIPQKSNTLEAGVNATEVHDHIETKIVDSTKEKNGESILKTNTE